jgi:hypothetical protein
MADDRKQAIEWLEEMGFVLTALAGEEKQSPVPSDQIKRLPEPSDGKRSRRSDEAA